jgi:uncharacterized protein (TIGR03083 family)
MPTTPHPSPYRLLPFDHDTVVSAYLDALHGMRSLAAQTPDELWVLPTDCPGWSVRDQFSHVVAVETDLALRPPPDHRPDWAALPHVSHEISQFLEVGVDYRRSRSPDAIRAELAEVISTREPMIAELPREADAPVRGVADLPSVAGRLGPVRAFDVWAHEQDVRRATDRPGRLDCPAARMSLDRIATATPIIVAKFAQAQPGQSVRFVVGQPQDVTISVEVGSGGRAAVVDDVGTPTTTLTMDFETFTRLACGRSAPEALDIDVAGDTGLGNRVLAAAAITP